ncbi:MAG: site-specific integrase [Propionibacteriaceae bacterium]|jgi:integrase|nr:site-specific integrase [Propionibacteriaceae bacterium]
MVKQSGRRGRGDGSLFQEASGRWIGMIDLGYRDGKRKRKKVSAATRAECRRKLKELIRSMEEGVIDADSKLSDWIEYWLTEICPQRVGAKTLYNYRRLLYLHVVPTIGSLKMKSLTPESIRSVHKRMRDQGLSESTIRTTHVILSRCLKVAEREDRIRRNVAEQTDAPSNTSTPARVLSVDQAVKVLASATDERELARLTCALVLGIRQGEALALKWDDIDFVNETLRIDESVGRVPGQGLVTKPPKTAAGNRTIPLPRSVAATLKDWATCSTDGSAYVFPGVSGGPEAPERDRKVWITALARAEVPRVKLHGARGTSASLLLEMGVSERVIADILGHANVRVTMRHYLHSSEEQRANALDKLADRLVGLSGEFSTLPPTEGSDQRTGPAVV